MTAQVTSELPTQQPWDLEKPPRRGAETVATAALVIALAALGVGIYALVKMPDVSQGPAGPQGATGPRGATGLTGPVGPKGAPGSTGAISNTSIVAGTPLKSVPNPPVGTVLTGTTACPSGTILLSGGAQVSAPGVQADRKVQLRSSLPIDKTHWQTVAIVTGSLGPAASMTMKPFVMCGAQPSTATSSTPTTASPTSR